MDKTALADLFRHMAWADAAAWTAVIGHPAACRDPRLKELLLHIHTVQYAFLWTWRGEPRDTFPGFDTLPALLDWGCAYHREAAAHLPTLADASLAAPMPLPWANMVEKAIGRPPAVTTLGDTVLQVALHSLHHRAQVNARLREIGATPNMVDYIAWVWFGRPEPAWPDVVGN